MYITKCKKPLFKDSVLYDPDFYDILEKGDIKQ